MSNTAYFICSSTNPDVLDIYVGGVLKERLTSGLSSEGTPNNTYIRFSPSGLLKRVDFSYAPSGSFDIHRRYMFGVGLDPIPAPSEEESYVDGILLETNNFDEIAYISSGLEFYNDSTLVERIA